MRGEPIDMLARVMAGLVIWFGMGGAALSQTASAVLPDESGQARLVWSALVALDHANRTGRYEVLHALGSTGFQQKNSVADLSGLFQPLRANRVDVGRAVTATPRYDLPARVDAGGVMRLRGRFDFRPRALLFDLAFEWQDGWRLLGISVAEAEAR